MNHTDPAEIFTISITGFVTHDTQTEVIVAILACHVTYLQSPNERSSDNNSNTKPGIGIDIIVEASLYHRYYLLWYRLASARSIAE